MSDLFDFRFLKDIWGCHRVLEYIDRHRQSPNNQFIFQKKLSTSLNDNKIIFRCDSELVCCHKQPTDIFNPDLQVVMFEPEHQNVVKRYKSLDC